jgi:DNA repair exonuclease SbcCD ATPase subunit
MRLTSLTLSNFRGFEQEQTIDLGGDVVVLWGPNGTGKTTVLDALQWLVVGDIPRLRRSTLKKDEDVVTSRYATGAPYVSVCFTDHADTQVEVTRHGVGKNMRLTLTSSADARALSGDEAELALAQIVGQDGPHESRARFGRVHLLQQDELTELLQADTKERYRFLANLTGLENLQRLDAQLRSELKALRAGLRERRDQAEPLQSGLAAFERERIDSANVETDRQLAAQQRLRHAIAHVNASLTRPSDAQPQQLLANASEMINTLRDRMNRLESLPGGVTDKADDLESQLTALQQATTILAQRIAFEERTLVSRAEELLALEHGHDRAQRLAQLALELIDEHCPVCGQTHDREATRVRLLHLLGDDDKLHAARRALDAQRAALTRAREKEISDRERVQHLEQQLQIVKRTAQDRERLCAEVRQLIGGEVSGDLVGLAYQRISSIEVGVEMLRAAIDESNVLQSVRERLIAASRDAEARGARLDLLQEEIADLERRVRSAEDVCRWLGAQVVETTARILDASTPLVNALYVQLDVHPTFRRFAFRSDRRYEAGHLRPWVYDDEEQADGNAVHVLSAAQLNALALCLFFALNLEEGERFAAAMLDDPVQSMDDVNVLSLVDVLRTLRRRRQLILTTHDLDLARLLTRKLRPLEDGQRTMFVTLANWSTHGPRVTVEAREPDAEPTALEIVDT